MRYADIAAIARFDVASRLQLGEMAVALVFLYENMTEIRYQA